MPHRSPDVLLSLLAPSPLSTSRNSVSRATTFCYLSQVPYLRSYNHNGRFYMDRDPDYMQISRFQAIGADY